MPSPIRRLGYAVDHFTAESTQMGFEGGGNDSIAGDASTSGTRSAEADAEAAGPTRVGGAGRAQATTPKMSANAEYPMRMLPLFVECVEHEATLGINDAGDDYEPAVSPDGDVLYFRVGA